MEKYIISIDLDGTLLNDNKEITPYTMKILKKCKKLGCKIMINTSRSYIRTLKYSKQINSDFVSCFNGNYLYGRDIYINNSFDNKIIKSINDIISKNDIGVIIETLEGSYRNKKNEYKFIETNYIEFDKIKLDNIYKIFVFSADIKYFDTIINDYDLKVEYDTINKVYRLLPNGSDKVNSLNYISNMYKDYKTISFGDDVSDYNMIKDSDIGIAMENSSEYLSDVIFRTDDNNKDGVGKLLSNMFNMDVNTNYKNVLVLDCTLRDGGHLNNSKFGYKNIINIINNLVKSKTDIIEIGFLEDCIYNKDIARFPKISDAEELIKDIDTKDSMICLLTQVDNFNIKNLTRCKGKVKMIRVSFHKGLLDDAIKFCNTIKSLGYICSLNPINFSGYNNYEVIKLLDCVNKLDIDYFTIVDTFGTLTNNSFSNKLKLINKLLRSDINLGLHLHDNLSSSFSTAQIIMKENSRKGNIIIDTSLLGMGRAPGNLKTELLMYYLNKYNNKYDMKYIYELIEKVIPKYKLKYNWDIDFRYSISAFNNAHRTYGEYLLNKGVSFNDADNIIKLIPNDKKDRYNESIIDDIYNKYRRNYVFR